MEKSQQTTQKVIKDYQQLYDSKVDSLEEMGEFLEKVTFQNQNSFSLVNRVRNHRRVTKTKASVLRTN